MDNSLENSNRGDQGSAPPDGRDSAHRHAVPRASERTHAAQRAAVARGLLPYTHNSEV